MKICPKCGRQNGNNSSYCMACGYKLLDKTGTGDSGTKTKLIIACSLAGVLIIGGSALLIKSLVSSSNNSASVSVASETEPEPEVEPEIEVKSEPEAESEPEVEQEQAETEQVIENELSEEEKNNIHAAYVNILRGYSNYIKSYENKIEEYNESFGRSIDNRQIAITDVNGDGIDELLFVADTDVNSNDGWEEYTEDLYIYTYQDGHPVKLYQNNIYTEVAGGYVYLIVKTTNDQLVIVDTATDDFEDCSIDRYSLENGSLRKEQHDGLLYYPNPTGEEKMYNIESNGTYISVSEEEFEEKTAAVSNDFDEVLIKNSVLDLSIYDIGKKQDSIAMTYEEAVGKEAANENYGFPKGSLSYNGHHYYIFEDIDGNWDEAMERCISRGGYLAVINDADENEMLFQYMTDAGFDCAYFGITDKYKEGKWQYIEGDQAAFTDWGTNSEGTVEPNNADGGESYAMIDIHMHDGHWNDAQFGRQVYTPDGESYRNRCAYICEWGL